jgi:hypothetical protein
MQWRAVTNDNDILRDGDMFRVWQADQTWSNWARVEMSIGSTLRDFVRLYAPRGSWHRGNPEAMVEVRRPVVEGEVCNE